MWVAEDTAKGEKAFVWAGKGTLCAANDCMAWRWQTEKPLQDIDLVSGDVEKSQRLGYCGLSGVAQHED